MLLLATEWYNYPGLELWKFANLAIFTGVGIYVLRKPISQALQSRRGAIEQELNPSDLPHDFSLGISDQDENEDRLLRIV